MGEPATVDDPARAHQEVRRLRQLCARLSERGKVEAALYESERVRAELEAELAEVRDRLAVAEEGGRSATLPAPVPGSGRAEADVLRRKVEKLEASLAAAEQMRKATEAKLLHAGEVKAQLQRQVDTFQELERKDWDAAQEVASLRARLEVSEEVTARAGVEILMAEQALQHAELKADTGCPFRLDLARRLREAGRALGARLQPGAYDAEAIKAEAIKAESIEAAAEGGAAS